MAVLLGVYAVVLAVATFVENRYGTPVAQRWIYHHPVFYLLQLLLAVNFIGIAIRQRWVQQRKWAVLCFHAAFVVILLGAFVTRLTGREGVMHIREGERSAELLDPTNPSRVVETLPFSVKLRDFRLVRYPGSHSPSSFESDVVVRQSGRPERAANIYMNNVLHIGPYRLYQSSYDPDERGTVLIVNRDRIGTWITYGGYILLIGGMVVALFGRRSRFRTLGRMLKQTAIPIVGLMMFALASSPVRAQERVDTMTVSQLEEQSRRQMERIERERPVGGAEESAERRTTVDRRREKKMAPVYAVEYAVSPRTAQAFGRLMVQSGTGRIQPVDTYAAEIWRKISRDKRYGELNADQVLLGLLTQPQIWSRVPMIDVGSEALLRQTGIDEEQAAKGRLAFIDVLDDEGNYIFVDEIERVYAKPVRERNKYDKELLKLDEKINILNALFAGRMVAIFPSASVSTDGAWYAPGDDLSAFRDRDSMFVSRIFPWFATEAVRSAETGDWTTPDEIVGMIATYQEKKAATLDISPRRIEAEMLYNRLDLFKWAGFGYMGFGLALMLISMLGWARPSKGWRVAGGVVVGIIGLLFLAQTAGVGLRWYIAGRPPVSNAYESMIFVSWATAIAGLAFGRRSGITLAAATFLSGVLMFVSTLNWMDPEITPLVPVLKSPWLLIHVAAITGSYGFFGIGFLLGLVSLTAMACRTERNAAVVDLQVRRLTAINEMSLIVGLVLLTAGTFLGAVWANESWGRYWGWDPKETWALITMMVYAFILHARLVPGLRRGGVYLFNVMSIMGLGAVLMTFFGVNYYLSGMHSYGGDSAPPALYIIWVVYGLATVVALLAWRKRVEH